jgi:hypothetical protein
MGYDVHITRAENWWDEDAPPISEDEWKSVVASDSSFEITGFAEAQTPKGEVIRIESPLLTVWYGHSSQSLVYFSFRRGHISCKNPDDEILQKMLQIAAKLDAKVQGDEGEIYNENVL